MKIKLEHLDTCSPQMFNRPDQGLGIILAVQIMDDMTEEELAFAVVEEWINNEDDHPLLEGVTARDIRQHLPSLREPLREARDSHGQHDDVFVYILVRPIIEA